MADTPADNHTRVFKIIQASREELYQAFLDPAALSQWLHPVEMFAEVHAMDARAGGEYRMSLYYSSSGQTHRGKTTENEDAFTARFLELTPPERIVQAVTFHSADPAFAGEMIFEATFQAVDGGAEVTLECRSIPPGIRPEDNETGSRESLENLARYIKSGRSDSPSTGSPTRSGPAGRTG